MLAYLALTAQTLCEFAFIAGLGLLQTDRALLPPVMAALAARLALGAASTSWLASLGGVARCEVQQNLWSLTVSKAGHRHAQQAPARHQRILSQAPTDAALGVVLPGVQALADATTLLLLEAALAVWSPAAGLLALLVVGALGASATLSVTRGSGRASQREALALETAHHLSWDVTHGARDILINDAVRLIRDRSALVVRALRAATRSYLAWTGGQRAALEGLSLTLVGLLSVLARGRTGGLIAGIAILRLIPILARLGSTASQVKNATSRTTAWSPTLRAALPGATPPARAPGPRPAPQLVLSVNILPGPGTQRRIGSPVRFQLARGDWIQLAGRSGAGKSSVLDAIAGLWEDFDGSIERDAATTLGYASQAPFLHGGTVADNIALGRDLGAEAVEAAARAAGLDECLGPGYQRHQLLDRGVNLSGGQRQRVSIARALVGRPDLLMLDEAMANLDRHAEETILQRIRLHLPDAAVILVTHRPAAIPWALHRVAM